MVTVHILRLPTDLPLKDLTKKLAMLLALTNASRSSDLHALDLRFRSFRLEKESCSEYLAYRRPEDPALL